MSQDGSADFAIGADQGTASDRGLNATYLAADTRKYVLLEDADEALYARDNHWQVVGFSTVDDSVAVISRSEFNGGAIDDSLKVAQHLTNVDWVPSCVPQSASPVAPDIHAAAQQGAMQSRAESVEVPDPPGGVSSTSADTTDKPTRTGIDRIGPNPARFGSRIRFGLSGERGTRVKVSSTM